MNRSVSRAVPYALCLAIAGCVLTQVGCVTYARHGIPANRVPASLIGPVKNAEVPVNLALLRQDPIEEYRLGPGDTLGIYVQGVLPPGVDQAPPFLPYVGAPATVFYPPEGQIDTTSIGVPLRIATDGNLQLPLIEPLQFNGLTLNQAAELIRKAYLGQNIVQMGRDRIHLTLLRPRVARVLVIREESASDVTQVISKDTVIMAKRGHAQVIDLPAFENDVLHALTTTGGLPGLDAVNQVWVLRTERDAIKNLETAQLAVESGREPQKIVDELRTHATAVRIPLRLCPDQPLPFSAEDIILNDGDIVYLEPRIAEVFYTGGLLPGGQIPLPRDYDLDIVEAIALAQGSVGGPGGVSGSGVFRTGAGPGNIIPPTRVLILRKLPNGEQLPIRVDLSRAMRDKKERIIIQPGDFVMLHYKPGELAGNVALNFFNFNVIFSPQN
jgi:protein involved in polysaccharide export with SLBB domain